MSTAHVHKRARRSRVVESSTPQPRRRRRRWPLVLPLMLLVAVWLAPVIIARPAIINRVANWALADLDGTIEIGSASLGWFSTVQLSDVAIRDAQGEPVIAVAAISSERSLLGLVTHLRDLGGFRINRPQVDLVIRDQSSNLETTFAAWLAAADDDTSPPEADDTPSSLAAGMSIEVTVDDGAVRIKDVATGRQGEIADLNALLRLTAGAPLELEARGRFADEGPAGTFDLKGALPLDVAAASRPGDGGQFDAHVDSLPLAMVGLLAQRVAPGTDLSGTLTALVHYRLATDDQPARLEADLVARQLVAAGPWLGDDQLHLARVQLPCRAAISSERITVDQLSLDCELGHVHFSGVVPRGESWHDALGGETLILEGDVDLAALAAALPSTLHVRDETRITAGQLAFELRRDRHGDGYAVHGHVTTDRVAAMHAGELIEWDEPLRAELDARHTANTFMVDRLRCQASFLSLEGSGTWDEFAAHGEFDLNRLAAELGQFIDLGTVELAGTGSLNVQVHRTDNETFHAAGDFQVRQLALSGGDGAAWRDELLVARVNASGSIQNGGLDQLLSATLDVESGADRLALKLADPVVMNQSDAVWSIVARLAGRLETWQPRLRPFVAALDDWQLAGGCELDARANWSAEMMEVAGVRVELSDFVVRGDGVEVREPKVHLAGTVRSLSGGERIELEGVAMSSATLACSSTKFVIDQPADGPFRADGTLQFQGDVHRLQAWSADPAEPPDARMWGGLTGQLAVRAHDNTTDAQLDARIEQLAVIWSDGTDWREPQVRLASHALYDAGAEQVLIDKLELASAALACTAKGSLAEPAGRRHVDLEGQLRYDLAGLEGLVRTFTGAQVRLQGRGERPFTVRGPLADGLEIETVASAESPDGAWLEELVATGGVDWQQIQAYGFVVGPGQIDARLERGVLGIAPLDVALSGGRLRARPSVRLAPGPSELTLAPGILVDRVQVTAEMCEQGLKYIAPVLAGVTRAAGSFSIDMSDCRVPLAAPSEGDLAGRLTVHTVEIGPGPLIQELALVLDAPRSVQIARDSQVGFRMVAGRVYHQGLRLVFPSNVTVQTSGSVGLDGTLAMVAEMPVPDKWIGSNALGDALRGRILQLPIGGTIDRPQLDRRVLAQLNAQTVRETAAETLRDELNKQINSGLNRLFNPR